MNAGAWLKSHKPEAALGVAGIVVAIVLYERSKNGSSSTSAANETYANPATVADTTDSDAYSGLESQILGLQTAFLGQSSSAAAATAASSTTPAVNNGFGVTQVNGQNYDELGNVSNGLFNGYNVGGGEPVFYESGGALLTDLSPTAIAGLPPGTEVLTVAQAGQQGQLSATPVSGEKI
ncbi:MAG: hypothetical protein ABSF84_02770 [Acidimicrobiales bacterium]|jgi:hypothetical protein